MDMFCRNEILMGELKNTVQTVLGLSETESFTIETLTVKLKRSDGATYIISLPSERATALLCGTGISSQERDTEEYYPQEEFDEAAYMAAMDMLHSEELHSEEKPKKSLKVRLCTRKGYTNLAPRPNGTGDWSARLTSEDYESTYNVVFPKNLVEGITDWAKLAEQANGADTVIPAKVHQEEENGRNILVVEEILPDPRA